MFFELKLFTVTNQSQSNSRIVLTVIILLYLLILINFALEWSKLYSEFIYQGINFWTVFQWFTYANNTIAVLGSDIIAGFSTVVADSTLVCV